MIMLRTKRILDVCFNHFSNNLECAIRRWMLALLATLKHGLRYWNIHWNYKAWSWNLLLTLTVQVWHISNLYKVGTKWNLKDVVTLTIPFTVEYFIVLLLARSLNYGRLARWQPRVVLKRLFCLWLVFCAITEIIKHPVCITWSHVIDVGCNQYFMLLSLSQDHQVMGGLLDDTIEF